MDEFEQDLKDHEKQSGRAPFFKLKNGNNDIVILTNPIGYSELFNVGIAYEDCGYGKYASRKYKCYVKDLSDGEIKIANFSYTTAKKLLELKKGARTKFDGFPMPYAINLQTTNAGTKEVETSVISGDDYVLTSEDEAALASYDAIQTIVDRLKASQKKKVENDPVLQQKIADILAKKEKEESDRKKNKEKDAKMGKSYAEQKAEAEDVETIEYPADEHEGQDIPF